MSQTIFLVEGDTLTVVKLEQTKTSPFGADGLSFARSYTPSALSIPALRGELFRATDKNFCFQ